MEFTGQIVGIQRDFESRLCHITLEVNEDIATETFQKYSQGERLKISIAKYYHKKSLNANNYLWRLCEKIAKHPHVKSTKEEIYYDHLIKHPFYFEEGLEFKVPEGTKMPKIFEIDPDHHVYWKYVRHDFFDRTMYYTLIKGSSMFDSHEMSVLLDDVIESAKGLGIDTSTDEEHQKMLEEWGRDFAKAQKRHNR